MTASHLFLLSAGGSMQQPVAWQTSKWAERWAENKALFREEVMQMMLDKMLLQLQLEVVRRAGDGKLCAVCILHHMSAENEKPEEAACRCNKTIWLGLISVTFGMRAARVVKEQQSRAALHRCSPWIFYFWVLGDVLLNCHDLYFLSLKGSF